MGDDVRSEVVGGRLVAIAFLVGRLVLEVDLLALELHRLTTVGRIRCRRGIRIRNWNRPRWGRGWGHAHVRHGGNGLVSRRLAGNLHPIREDITAHRIPPDENLVIMATLSPLSSPANNNISFPIA